MSRSGYTDDCDEQWQFIMWRGSVKSSIRVAQAKWPEIMQNDDGWDVLALRSPA